MAECFWCGGSGKVECDCTCGMGKEHANYECLACGGEGYHTCPECHGSGKTEDDD